MRKAKRVAFRAWCAQWGGSGGSSQRLGRDRKGGRGLLGWEGGRRVGRRRYVVSIMRV